MGKPHYHLQSCIWHGRGLRFITVMSEGITNSQYNCHPSILHRLLPTKNAACWWVTGPTATAVESLQQPGAAALPSWNSTTNVEECLSNTARAWPSLVSPTQVRRREEKESKFVYDVVKCTHVFLSPPSVEMLGHPLSSRLQLPVCSRHGRLPDNGHLFGWEVPADRSPEPRFNLVRFGLLF